MLSTQLMLDSTYRPSSNNLQTKQQNVRTSMLYGWT